MPIVRIASFACLALALLLSPAWAGGNLDAYLTKEGKLTQTLDIRDVQGGFAGFTGKYYKVEPDGKWSTGQLFNKKQTEEKSGKLTRDEVVLLAKALAKNDLLDLKSEGKQGTNPHVVTIKFGKVEGTLTLGAGTPLPKVDAMAKKLTMEQRYAAIVELVRGFAEKKSVPQDYVTPEGKLTETLEIHWTNSAGGGGGIVGFIKVEPDGKWVTEASIEGGGDVIKLEPKKGTLSKAAVEALGTILVKCDLLNLKDAGGDHVRLDCRITRIVFGKRVSEMRSPNPREDEEAQL